MPKQEPPLVRERRWGILVIPNKQKISKMIK